MYVCVCEAVTERELHAAIDAGAVTLARLRERLQVASCCGKCTDDVKTCMRRALAGKQANRSGFPVPNLEQAEALSA